MKVESLDHLVLYVENIEDSVAFYQRVLGMRKIVFAQSRLALGFGNQKINLHPLREPLQPHALNPQSGSADLCFITPLPLQDAMQHVRDCGVEILLGPVQRSGANTSLISFYIRDPDGNLLEIANSLTS